MEPVGCPPIFSKLWRTGYVPRMRWGGALTTERRTVRGLYSFLSHLVSGVDPVPGFERICLIWVDPDRMLHLMHLLFSVPVGLYSTARRLFDCVGELNEEGLPPLAEIPVEAFAVRRTVRAVPQDDHVSHMEGVTQLTLQSMPCKREEKLLAGA